MSTLRARAAALFLFLLASCVTRGEAPQPPITAAELMRHIEVLASDDYEGRAPASEGERLTIAYISRELARRGAEPGAGAGWLQPVGLVERSRGSHRSRWTAGGRTLPFDESQLTLFGREANVGVADAPVVFVGHGYVDRSRGIDQLAGADVAGAVALMILEGPDVPGFPSFEERVRTVTEAGAAAVLAVIGDDIPFPDIVAAGSTAQTRLEIEPRPAALGAISASAVTRLVAAAGGDFRALLDERGGPQFRAVPLGLRASFDVVTPVRRTVSNNVVGRIPGTGGGRESVLLLAHWDHLGLCRPEGAEDRICNGAVDNASGIAMLIEVAGRLAAGPRPERDILIVATTAEEVGLLGAEHFAARPTVPLPSIVAAVNLDTVAIHGRGEPVAVIGRGIEPLDRAIAETAARLGRQMDTSFAADAFLRRQDGWALARAGVPAVMVGGSFANVGALEDFLSGDYHGPDDEPRADLPLEGAAEDANLLVALIRRLADPGLYQPPSAPARPNL